MLVHDEFHTWAPDVDSIMLERNLDKLIKLFDVSMNDVSIIRKCPECNHTNNLIGLLAHLNNSPEDSLMMFWKYKPHAWSFKQIGEWLKTLGL